MTSDLDQLKVAAEQFQGQTMAHLMAGISPQEHLDIIRKLAKVESTNPALKIEIAPGSTPNNYEYTVSHNTTGQDNSRYGVKMPDDEVQSMAKAMGVNADQIRGLLKKQNDTAAAEVTSTPVIHEEFKANPFWHKLVSSNEVQLH